MYKKNMLPNTLKTESKRIRTAKSWYGNVKFLMLSNNSSVVMLSRHLLALFFPVTLTTHFVVMDQHY